MLTYKILKEDPEIQTLLKLSERQLEVLGFTEHGHRHVGIVTQRVETILRALEAEDREVELGKIAALLHDVGNGINRNDHAQSGALLAYQMLTKRSMDCKEAAEIMMAIGNHDEGTGLAVSRIGAALILADKSDVHRSRVRKDQVEIFKRSQYMEDIHDRVNYAVEKSDLLVDRQTKHIIFRFKVDTEICSAMDYFQIFMERMQMCRQAADFIGYEFQLMINDYNLA